MKITDCVSTQKIQQNIFNSKTWKLIQKIAKITLYVLLGISCIYLIGYGYYNISIEVLKKLAYPLISIGGLCLLAKKLLKTYKIHELCKILDTYNKNFTSLNQNIYIGKIEKIELEEGAQIFLKADLHGSLKDLTENLNNLQKLGYLDKDFNVKKEWKYKLLIAFLGDYIDRGPDSWKVLDLLMKLKINNPNEILLLRGNHENLKTSFRYIHPKEKYFFYSSNFTKKLELFFNSLSLAAFVGKKQNNDEIQYVCLTHGALDLDIEAQPLLKSTDSRATMILEKNDNTSFLNNRLTKLVSKKFHKIKINTTKEALLLHKRIKELLNNWPLKILYSQKQKKLKESELKIYFFIKQYEKQIKTMRLLNQNNYCWGDIEDNCFGFNHSRGIGFSLTPALIKDYFRLISSETRKVKALRAGHAHYSKSFALDNKKGFIEILPAAGELKCYDKLRAPIDKAKLITPKDKVKDWEEKDITRKRKAECQLNDSHGFYQYA